jgi:hypothetical protein
MIMPNFHNLPIAVGVLVGMGIGFFLCRLGRKRK